MALTKSTINSLKEVNNELVSSLKIFEKQPDNYLSSLHLLNVNKKIVHLMHTGLHTKINDFEQINEQWHYKGCNPFLIFKAASRLCSNVADGHKAYKIIYNHKVQKLHKRIFPASFIVTCGYTEEEDVKIHIYTQPQSNLLSNSAVESRHSKEHFFIKFVDNTSLECNSLETAKEIEDFKILFEQKIEELKTINNQFTPGW